MNKREDETIMLLAIEHYGAKNQAARLMGEMGELAAELTRHFLSRKCLK